MEQLHIELSLGYSGPLITELHSRLHSMQSPRLLIDGLWFTVPNGGVSRVWRQILSTFSLPGMIANGSPICFINRGLHSSFHIPFEQISGTAVDPFDVNAVFDLTAENSSIAFNYGADVFCSTSCSSIDSSASSCSQIALVHDCLPERFLSFNSHVLNLRRRWIKDTSLFLCVSSDTASDLHSIYGLSMDRIAWTHLSPSPEFSTPLTSSLSNQIWEPIISFTGLSYPFIHLPGSASIGSYKNPEFLGHVLSHPSLFEFNLFITGVNSSLIANTLVQSFPFLANRIFTACLSDIELSFAYKNAFAVVIPSLIEGFGLPAIEALKVSGLPLIADVRGLREAGSEAALRFDPRQPSQLIDLLNIFNHPPSALWLSTCLRSRGISRLSRLCPDLIGLSLLAQSRSSVT